MKRFLFIACMFLFLVASSVVSIASDHSPIEKAALFKVDDQNILEPVFNNDMRVADETVCYQHFSLFEKSKSYSPVNLVSHPLGYKYRQIDLAFKTSTSGYKGLPILSWRC